MKEKRDFFISYNSADSAWAEWIAWQLEAAGYETVIQAWDFQPGSNFVLDMQRASSECERTIAVLSPDYLNALYPQPEWAAAFGQDPTGSRGTLLPIRVRECELEGMLATIVYIDLVGIPEPKAIDRLKSGARRDSRWERTKPKKAPGFPGQDRPKFPTSAMPLASHTPIDLELVVTYSSKDVDQARTVRDELEKYGLDVWRDQERIKVGAEFGIEIEQAIRRADAIVVLITDNAGRSEWVRNEIEYAKYAKKPIIPLLLDKDAPPIITIMGLQHIPFHEDRSAGLTALVEHLRELEAGKEAPTESPAQVQAAIPSQPSLEQVTPDANPFIYGGGVPAEFFVGRESALAAIQNRVGNYYSLQSISIVSNRRMGKTSLLNYIWKRYETLFPSDHEYVTVFIDAMDARAHTVAGVMRILRRAVSRKLQRELWPEGDDGKLQILSEALEELAEDDDIRLVLLLDEWESVMAHPELDSLLYTLRSSGSRSWIGMITATAHRLSELHEKGGLVSNFYNIFATVFLGNMPPGEWQGIIRRGFERGKYEVRQQDFDLIEDLAGGHPYLTQLAGSLLWQAEKEGWDAAQIRTRFVGEARMIFTDIWQRLNADQIQGMMYALALDGASSVPESILTDLKLRGALTEEGNVFCKPFADFILHETR